jgi:hypothetical protein
MVRFSLPRVIDLAWNGVLCWPSRMESFGLRYQWLNLLWLSLLKLPLLELTSPELTMCASVDLT